MSSGAGNQTKEGEPVHLFRLDTDECRYLWVPLQSLCQLSTNIGHLALVLPGCVNSQALVVIKFWDISWQRSKGVPRLVSAGVCALKPMIFTFYDIILLTEPCFQNYGGIAKPMNC